jgi:uncharacterized protein YidB (DUF937 family)
MGLMDALMGAAGQAARDALQGQGTAAGGMGAGAGPGVGGLDPQMLIGLLSTLLNQAGGLQGLLAKLQAGGLGEAVQSWVGTGPNQAVSPDRLNDALGPDLMGMVARQLGGNSQAAGGLLAALLPQLVDQLTPQGQLPADNGMGALGALLGGFGGAGGEGGAGTGAGQLMGALGSLLGRR